MSDSNQLSQPLGNGIPLPGGDPVDTPEQRQTVPGGSPGGGGTPSSAGGPMSFADSHKALSAWHSRNRAMYEETGKALKKLDVIRKGLEKLSDKQDLVTMEDVVEEAGKLVAHGIDPVSLAGLLADAPQEGGGEALGGWIAGHAQTAMLGEQNMIAQHNLAKHNMGVSAMHMLMADANGQNMMGNMPQQSESNDMSPPGTEDTPGDYSMGNSLNMGRRFMGKR